MEFHAFLWLLNNLPCPEAYSQPSYLLVPEAFTCATKKQTKRKQKETLFVSWLI